MATGPLSLNIDLGELPSEPEELYELATIVNVACGGHAGDEGTMRRAVALAKKAGARVAAHPSYPDRVDFGRRSIELEPQRLKASLVEQMRALERSAREVDLEVYGVKPHGALYHDVAHHAAHAALLVEAISASTPRSPSALVLIGPGSGALYELAQREGLEYLREGFADRGMRSDGTLIARDQPGALIEDPSTAAHQSITLAESGTVETICVHGDTEGALAIARAVRSALVERGFLR